MPSPLSAGILDYDAEREDIAQRIKYADALREQAGATPQTQVVGNRAIPLSWAQGLAQAVKGGISGYTRQNALAEQKSLSERRGAALANAMSNIPQAQTTQTVTPTDQQGTGSFDMSGSAGPPVQTQTVNPTMQQNAQWLASLSTLGKDAQGMGTTMLGFQQKHDENKAAQEARSNDKIMALAQAGNLAAQEEVRKHEMQQSQQQFQQSQQSRQQEFLDAQHRQAALDREALMRASAGNRPPPAVTAVTIQDPNDPNGTVVIDGRTQQVLGKGPKMTDSGKLNQKREFNMAGIGKTITDAEEILSGKGGRDLPTGSTIGNVVDTAAGVFGKNPAGSKEAERMKAIGGALVSKMPRMEGPQSDKDVALYKEMAGRVGDPTVTRERRLAALEEVKNLWGKYEKHNPDAFADRRAGGGNVVDFNSLPK